MTVVQLRQLARSRGLRGYSRLRKRELLDLLYSPPRAVPEPPRAVPEPPRAVPELPARQARDLDSLRRLFDRLGNLADFLETDLVGVMRVLGISTWDGTQAEVRNAHRIIDASFSDQGGLAAEGDDEVDDEDGPPLVDLSRPPAPRGLSCKQRRKVIRVASARDKRDDPSCPICMEDYGGGKQDENRAMRTQCGHLMCRTCTERWFKDHVDCPMCKRVLGPPVTNRPRMR